MHRVRIALQGGPSDGNEFFETMHLAQGAPPEVPPVFTMEDAATQTVYAYHLLRIEPDPEYEGSRRVVYGYFG